MTRTRDSTHVDTVGEKHGRVVLTWRLHWNTRPILHDGPRRWPAVKMAVLFGGATPRNPPIMGGYPPPHTPLALGRTCGDAGHGGDAGDVGVPRALPRDQDLRPGAAAAGARGTAGRPVHQRP